MITKILKSLRSFAAAFPEVPWMLGALFAWWILGLAMEPFTATYPAAFLHKAVITLFRVLLAVTITDAVVAICWPTVREWVRAGSWRTLFTSEELTPEQQLRLRIVTAVHLVIFGCVMVSLSL